MTQKPDNPPAMMTNEQLAEALRTKADMINMGERIAWGSETALMRQAADVIQQQRDVMRMAREALDKCDRIIAGTCDFIHAKPILDDARASKAAIDAALKGSE